MEKQGLEKHIPFHTTKCSEQTNKPFGRNDRHYLGLGLEPAGAVLQATGAALEPTGSILEAKTGAVLDPTDAIMEPTSAILEPTKVVLEHEGRRPEAGG